jgi:AraC family transcriptional activator of mtrCDE
MDLLSRLLSLTPVSGRLEQRCRFGSPWAVDEVPADAREIPYHVLLEGTAVIEDAHGPAEPLVAGDIVLFPAGSAHRIHDGSGQPPRPITRSANELPLARVENGASTTTADFLCGRFILGAVPDHLLRDHLPSRLVVRSAAHAGTVRGQSQLARLIELMREEADHQGPGSETLMNHLSAALFSLTLRFASTVSQPAHGLLALASKPRLQPAISAMFDRPGEQWSLEQFATLCNMSKATFVRQFQDAIGRSATDVLTEVRMTIAGRMLLQTAQPVADIGEAVGYQSDAAFQRVFKRQIGVTPARWRASNRDSGSHPDGE